MRAYFRGLSSLQLGIAGLQLLLLLLDTRGLAALRGFPAAAYVAVAFFLALQGALIALVLWRLRTGAICVLYFHGAIFASGLLRLVSLGGQLIPVSSPLDSLAFWATLAAIALSFHALKVTKPASEREA